MSDTPANSLEAAHRHHKQHGDMDGDTCLLGACALHYPAPPIAELEAEVERLREQTEKDHQSAIEHCDWHITEGMGLSDEQHKLLQAQLREAQGQVAALAEIGEGLLDAQMKAHKGHISEHHCPTCAQYFACTDALDAAIKDLPAASQAILLEAGGAKMLRQELDASEKRYKAAAEREKGLRRFAKLVADLVYKAPEQIPDKEALIQWLIREARAVLAQEGE